MFVCVCVHIYVRVCVILYEYLRGGGLKTGKSLQYIWEALGRLDIILSMDDFFIIEPGTKPVLSPALSEQYHNTCNTKNRKLDFFENRKP